ncbi:MAG TPA: immunoglobulin domain-containing protein, partial [Verrucomicrobiae bacterium]|nr:immunoglobulin domain-containing protein [Verrucomicrobiae bacterium]
MNTCPRLFAAVVFGFLSFFAARSRGTGAPAISTQPQSQSVRAGSNALFTVSATGQSPLAYQWSLNGTDLTNNAHLSGATGTNLVVNNVGAADAGSYQVIVSNSHGSATSSNATLTVLLPPAIDAEPANTATCFGGPASFSVSATGTAPLVYQWYFNGSALSDNAQVTGSAGAVLNLS